jgi:hypothetical protein
MAPELALAHLADLSKGRIVLDPMSGSGTVLRQASVLGLRARGFDVDPLAVLMSRVWTTAVKDSIVETLFKEIMADAKKAKSVTLPWMDDDPEARAFAKYWFGRDQRRELRRLAFVLAKYDAEAGSGTDRAAVNVLRLALSRIIITKDKGASLGRDISHSRPHKVMETNDYNVRIGYERSVRAIRKRLADEHHGAFSARVSLGDARRLKGVDNCTVDAILTSPPYLNAIDYLRGHRLSLIWLGHRLRDLRAIRSNSIGSERGPNKYSEADEFTEMKLAMGELDVLPDRFARMIDRYIQDLYQMIKELVRVLKRNGKATFVVGNSCLRGVFIKNAGAIETAATLCGLTLTHSVERDLPQQSRYLPVTMDGTLGKRMRTETILSFTKLAA